jgi:hypothetical protein
MLSQGRSVSGNARLLYAGAAIALFCVEVAIALFVNDAFVRPYVGDVLAILLVYTALRAATPLSLRSALATTLAIAVLIEVAQAAKLLSALGLGENGLARIVFGGSFDWLDLLAYAAGGIVIVGIELARPGKGA